MSILYKQDNKFFKNAQGWLDVRGVYGSLKGKRILNVVLAFVLMTERKL